MYKCRFDDLVQAFDKRVYKFNKEKGKIYEI